MLMSADCGRSAQGLNDNVLFIVEVKVGVDWLVAPASVEQGCVLMSADCGISAVELVNNVLLTVEDKVGTN